MKRSIKKVVAAVVVSSMLFSFAACSNKANEEVVEAADSFASAVLKRDSKKIYELTNVDKKKQDDSLFNYDDNMDGKNIKEAILDNIDAEVDEESVEASSKDGEGSVDVIFMIPDYETVFDETEASNEDDLIKEIKKAEKNEVKVTVEFEKEDDEWLVSNAPKVLDKVFGDIATISVPTFVNLDDVYFSWYYEDDCTDTEAWYTNVYEINVDIWGLDDYSTVSYKCTYNGEVIAEEDDYDCYITAGYEIDADEFGNLPAGDYTIVFSVGGKELAPLVAHVTSEAAEIDYDWYGMYDDYEDNECWYEDVKYINVECWSIHSSEDIYYTVSLDGSVIYTSDNDYYNYDAYYGDDYGTVYGNNPLDENGLLPEGDYVFTFYSNGIAIEPAAIAHVTNTQGGSGNNSGVDIDMSNVEDLDPMTLIMDQDFADNTVAALWMDSDGYGLSEGNNYGYTYSTSDAVLNYYVEGTTDLPGTIYYAIYKVDDLYADPDFENPYIEDSISLDSEGDIAWYDIMWDSDGEGVYIIFLGDSADFNSVYVISQCVVE